MSFQGSRRAGVVAFLPALLAGLLALRPPPAFAAELPRLALVPVRPVEGAPERSAARLTGMMLDELATRDTELRLLPPRGMAKKGGAREAADAFALGQKKLADLQFAPAATAFTRGLELSMGDPANADFEAMREAYVSLAVARFRMGQEKEAQAALAEVARLSPSYRLPSGRYPPIFVNAFEKARAAEAKGPKGTLKVDGPAGWKAFVDGRAVGPFPASVPNLRYGAHLLRGEGPKGERAGQVVGLSSPVTQAELDLGALAAPPELPAVLDADAAARLDAYCKLLKADFALVAVLAPSGPVNLLVGAALYSARTHGFTAFAPFKVDEELGGANVEVFKLAEQLAPAMAPPGPKATPPIDLLSRPKVAEAKPEPKLTPAEKPPVAPGPLATPAPPPKREPVLWAGVPWWVWVAGGAGVAAVAGGTYYGISQANRRATGTVTATW